MNATALVNEAMVRTDRLRAELTALRHEPATGCRGCIIVNTWSRALAILTQEYRDFDRLTTLIVEEKSRKPSQDEIAARAVAKEMGIE